jgi:3-oxoadipate enol-lactonase
MLGINQDRPFRSTELRSRGNNLRIIVNGLVVSYNDNGPIDAPVIIFVHGFPFNKWMWARQADDLKNQYRVIAYDIRGYGDSESGNEEFTIDLFISDLIAFMNKLGLDKVMLCGLSMGGYIALGAIEKFPERFSALVLSDTQCEADTAAAGKKRLEAIETIKEKGQAFFAEETLKKLVASESFTNRGDEIKAIREMILNTSKQSLYKTLLALMMRKETCSRLAEIKVPVLIMTGEEDEVIPADKARYMHEKIEHSYLHFIEHAGHVANMENAPVFNSNLRKFASRFAK